MLKIRVLMEVQIWDSGLKAALSMDTPILFYIGEADLPLPTPVCPIFSFPVPDCGSSVSSNCLIQELDLSLDSLPYLVPTFNCPKIYSEGKEFPLHPCPHASPSHYYFTPGSLQ